MAGDNGRSVKQMPEPREEIKTALEQVGNRGFADAVVELLKTLGYESERARYFSGTPKEFNQQSFRLSLPTQRTPKAGGNF